MPFTSLAQSKAAFSGALGPEMKDKAHEFAAHTDYSRLPEHVGQQHHALKLALNHKPKG